MIDCSNIPYKDKGCHFIAGFVITLIIGLIAYYIGVDYPQGHGVLAGVLAGVCKEAWDLYSYGKFDFYDIIATWAGTFFGGAIVILI